MPHHLLSPQNDLVFKRLFGSKAHQAMLIKMLNAVLFEHLTAPIASVTFLDNDLSNKSTLLKQSIVDVHCQDQKGDQYIVEMQVAKTYAFDKRVQLYMAKALNNQVLRGSSYKHIKRVIFLGFTNHILFREEKNYKTVHTMRSTGSKKVYLDHMRYTFVELPKFTSQCGHKKAHELTLEEKFYYFLHEGHCMPPQQRKALIASEKSFQEAFTALECASWTEGELRHYEAIEKTILDNLSAEDQRIVDAKEEGIKEGEARGIEKGKQEGIEEGVEKGKKAMAKARKKANVDPLIIKEVTGMDPLKLV